MGKIYLSTEETSEEVLSTLADGVNIGLVKIPPFPKIVEVIHTNK